MRAKIKSFSYKFLPAFFILLFIIIWQYVSNVGVLPNFMLPSPKDVALAFWGDFPNLIKNTTTTLKEAILGLLISIFVAFIISFFMDRFELINRTIYAILILTQTVPAVAIAPLLVLWFGYGIFSKIILVAIVCFFPITIGLLEGLKSIDCDNINLLKSMGATKFQIFKLVKLPSSLGSFFGGLKIAVSYSVVGAVIAEWLGGYDGLGVYMIRVKKSYSFDKMFAVIFLISVISLIMIKSVDIIKHKIMKWEYNSK